MTTAQTTIPSHFKNAWRVAGAPAEDENAGRICSVLGYTRDEDDNDIVRVRYADDGSISTVYPFMLLPA